MYWHDVPDSENNRLSCFVFFLWVGGGGGGGGLSMLYIRGLKIGVGGTKVSTCATFQTQRAYSRSSHHTRILLLEPPPPLISNREKRRLWERNWFEIRKPYS